MSSLEVTHHPEEEFGFRAPSIDDRTAISTPADPEKALSPSATFVDLAGAALEKRKDSDTSPSLSLTTEDTLPVTIVDEVASEKVSGSDRPQLSQGRKWTLLAIFSLAMFIDIWCYSAFFIFTDPISVDLDVLFEQQSWIITSYSVTFAAFLLFWGRVSDLYSAKPVFVWGFAMLGVLNLIISFMPDKYSFFVLRALAGISGAALIPASYRLITFVFPPEELGMAFTIYGTSGAISNVTGTIVAGFIMYIPGSGQMAAWRWFFRILAALVIPVALAAFYIVPRPTGSDAHADTKTKLKRLDLVGSFIMLSAIILLILGLTLGASYGWKKPGFLVPFLLSFVLFPLFFIWEARIPEEYALIPPKTWAIPNFTVWIVFALQIYPWWGVNFLALVEVFTTVHGEKAIIAAVRVLPQGIIAFAVTLLLTWKPQLVSRPRYTVTIGMVFGIIGYVLMTRPTSYIGAEYWKFLFPAFILGSGGLMAAFTATNVGVMTSVPAESSGVAGAVLQVSYQVGSAVGFSIQAGLFTVNPGSISNPANVHASFYFQMGWAALWLIGFLAFFRQAKRSVSSDADGAEQGRVIITAH